MFVVIIQYIIIMLLLLLFYFYKQFRLPTTRLNCSIIFNIDISVYSKIFKKKKVFFKLFSLYNILLLHFIIIHCFVFSKFFYIILCNTIILSTLIQ